MKSFPFTSPKLRNQRILTYLSKGFIMSGKYNEGVESLSFLFPLIDRKSCTSDIIELIEILIENKLFETELNDMIRKLTNPEDSMINGILRNIKQSNYQDAQNLIKQVRSK